MDTAQRLVTRLAPANLGDLREACELARPLFPPTRLPALERAPRRTATPDVAFPHELRPSAKYRGEVTLETANPVGQLVLADFFVYDNPVQS